METIKLLLIVSLLNVGIWVLCLKWELIKWYQFRRAKWMPDSCNFCFFFWLAMFDFLFLAAWAAIKVKAIEFDIIDYIAYSFLYSLCCAVLSLFFKPKAL
jgi:hypothetical protein